MLKKDFLKLVLCLLFFVGLTVSTFAQVTISGGFALSGVLPEVNGYSDHYEVGLGGNIYVDWLLKIKIPLSLGFEVGFDSAKAGDGSDAWNAAVPILLRVAYHFDLPIKLDLYAVGKIGYAFSFWLDTPSYFHGVAFGVDIGAAYYFIPHFGIFAEAGYDLYYMEGKATSDYGWNATVKLPFSRFFTIGISTKF